MNRRRSKNLICAAICAALFVVFLRLGIPIWFLFIVLTIYYAYQGIKGGSSLAKPEPAVVPESAYGQLGSYAVEGDAGDLSYGMYVRLNGESVFIDLREDSQLEGRKRRAQWLYDNRSELETDLKRFIAANPDFQNKKISSIGLHSKDLQRAEVFWEPEGYTLLQGLQFVSGECGVPGVSSL